ncbi:MAG: hypothetical protein AAB513_00525 [Patescibacteria group bacterium]
MTSVNVEVVKNANENATNLIRRFTKRVQGSGILNRVRSIRYNERNKSYFVRKKKALTKLAKKAVFEEAVKLGKVIETKKYRRR